MMTHQSLDIFSIQSDSIKNTPYIFVLDTELSLESKTCYDTCTCIMIYHIALKSKHHEMVEKRKCINFVLEPTPL